jgi:hypothetical protein
VSEEVRMPVSEFEWLSDKVVKEFVAECASEFVA